MRELFVAVAAFTVLVAVLMLITIGIAIYGLFVFPFVSMGIVGFYYVKTKFPLVDPYYPFLARLIVSALWACAITIALYCCSVVLVGWDIPTAKFPYAIAMQGDGLQFFLESTAVIFFASVTSIKRAALGRTGTLAAACLCAAVLLSSPLLAHEKIENIVDFISKYLDSFIQFFLIILRGIQKLIQDGPVQGLGIYAFDGLRYWILSANGNLFVLGSGLAKLFWLIAIYNFIKSLLSDARPDAGNAKKSIARLSIMDSSFILGAIAFSAFCLIQISTILENGRDGYSLLYLSLALTDLWVTLIFGKVMRSTQPQDQSLLEVEGLDNVGWALSLLAAPAAALAAAFIVGIIAHIIAYILYSMGQLAARDIENFYLVAGGLGAAITFILVIHIGSRP